MFKCDLINKGKRFCNIDTEIQNFLTEMLIMQTLSKQVPAGSVRKLFPLSLMQWRNKLERLARPEVGQRTIT